MNNLEKVINYLGSDKVKINEPMFSHTTFRIGGPADLFFEARNKEDIKKAIEICAELNVPYMVLGVGANLLVGDKGVRGLVIRIANSNMEVVGPIGSNTKPKVSYDSSHYRPFDTKRYLKFDDLDYVDPEPDTYVLVGAGVSLPALISWSLDQGLTGLHPFAGVPASVGGAIYNNIHGGTKLFDQLVSTVTLVNDGGEIIKVDHDEMDFRYDHSRLQESHEIVLESILKLSHGDVRKAKWVREEWLKRKLKVQPQRNCPGCIFKNLTKEEVERIGAPTVATAWVLDVGLALKGTKVGGVSVSQMHANFFVNDGSGKASDVLELIKICKEKAVEEYSLELKEEIQMVGEF